jgi:nitrate reductase NapAB chaperone NapD
MPVLGAVVHWRPGGRQAVLEHLLANPAFTVGQETAGRLPIVIESASPQQDKALWNELLDLPECAHLELAFADFSDVLDLQATDDLASGLRRRPRPPSVTGARHD